MIGVTTLPPSPLFYNFKMTKINIPGFKEVKVFEIGDNSLPIFEFVVPQNAVMINDLINNITKEWAGRISMITIQDHTMDVQASGIKTRKFKE